MKRLNEFWTITIDGAELQWHTFALQSKGECFLSAHTKLVGVDKAVLLSTRDLAESFREATLLTLRRRHGEAVRSTVATCRTSEVQVDDLLVQARIREGAFAPNRRPACIAADGRAALDKNQIKAR
jgi:hypothetical protein